MATKKELELTEKHQRSNNEDVQ